MYIHCGLVSIVHLLARQIHMNHVFQVNHSTQGHPNDNTGRLKTVQHLTAEFKLPKIQVPFIITQREN